jgi:ADP-heptose:LPS heptosyltransferase/glycosyltransferase involved in cell wall biosynthesis
MRILAVSNFYPPNERSGYELGSLDIVESLRTRGHQVKVLTSDQRSEKDRPEGNVCRWLKTGSKERSDWRSVFIKELVNQKAFRRICSIFPPDVILFFNLTDISTSLALLAEDIGFPTSFYLADTWFAAWEKDQWYQVWPRGEGGSRILRFMSRRFNLKPPRPPLRFANAAFTNNHLKAIAVELKRAAAAAPVIPWGIDQCLFQARESHGHKLNRLLYVGELRPHKGLDTAIRALGILKREYGCERLSLTVAEKNKGLSSSRAYFRDLSERCGVVEEVRFEPPRPRRDMADVYRAHDVLVFPSSAEDSLTLTLLEAMSCGLAVVSTPTCGQADVLKDGHNALIFPAENAEFCAQQILRLLNDPGLYESMAENARNTIDWKFTLEKCVDAVERLLEAAVNQTKEENHRHAVSWGAPLPEETHPSKPQFRVFRRVRRMLRLGAMVVSLRTLLKPAFYVRVLRRITQKGLSLAALIVFPVFLEAFFRLAGRRRRSPGTDVSKLRNVMVLQLADMGDILLSGPFLRQLKRFMPRARIILVVQPSMLNLVRNCPYVDEVVSFPWRAAKNWRTAFSGTLLWWLQSFWITSRSLWGYHLDLAISLRWNNEPCQAASLILMYASSARQRIGYHDYPHHLVGYKLTDVNRLITRGPVRGFPEHEIERQLDILRFLGADPDQFDRSLELWTTAGDERFTHDLFGRHGLSTAGMLVAFAPGAAWPFRRWPVDRFIELGRWIQEEYGAYVLIFAARNERELASRIVQGLQREQALDLAGQTTIRQMGSILRRCRLFVGNDSGPMHVAVAAGVPVVGLFGPGEYERFRPWGPDHDVIRLAFPCSPCSQNCLFDEARCIKGISVSLVKAAIAKKLEPVRG